MTSGQFLEVKNLASKEENKLIKRNKIIKAAHELFSKNGINMTAIDDVVKKAGVAKGTFYLYFKDKYALMDYIVLHESAVLVNKALEEVDLISEEQHLEPIDKILLFVDKIIDCMVENKEILALIDSKISGFFQMLITEDNPETQQNINGILTMLTDIGYSQDEARKYLYTTTCMLITVGCESVLCGSPYEIDEIKPQIHLIIRKLLSK